MSTRLHLGVAVGCVIVMGTFSQRVEGSPPSSQADGKERRLPHAKKCPAAEPEPPRDTATRIALIDMEFVFKNSKKFVTLTTELNAEVEESDAAAQEKGENFNERRLRKRQFLIKEAEAYKSVYQDVTRAVQGYAMQNGYRLVIRFNRQPLDAARTPQDTIGAMNRQIVFHYTEDDITDAITDVVNSRFDRERIAACDASRP